MSRRASFRVSRPRSISAEDILSPTCHEKIFRDQNFEDYFFNSQHFFEPCSDHEDQDDTDSLSFEEVCIPMPNNAEPMHSSPIHQKSNLNHLCVPCGDYGYPELIRPKSSMGFYQDMTQDSFMNMSDDVKSKSNPGYFDESQVNNLQPCVTVMQRSVSTQSFHSEVTEHIIHENEHNSYEPSLSCSLSHHSILSDDEEFQSTVALSPSEENLHDKFLRVSTDSAPTHDRPETIKPKTRRSGQTEAPIIQEKPYFPEVDGSFTHLNNNLLHPFNPNYKQDSLNTCMHRGLHERRASDLPGFTHKPNCKRCRGNSTQKSSSSSCLTRKVLISQHWTRQLKHQSVNKFQVYIVVLNCIKNVNYIVLSCGYILLLQCMSSCYYIYTCIIHTPAIIPVLDMLSQTLIGSVIC